MTETATFLDGFRLLDGSQLNNALNNPLWSYDTLVATPGGTVNTSKKITSAIVQVAGVSGAGISLPQALPGQICIVQNTGNTTLTVYALGGSTIDGLDGSIGLPIGPYGAVIFVATSLLEWNGLSFGSVSNPGNVVFTSTNLVVSANDRYIYGSAPLGDITVSLPAASGQGRILTFKKIDAAANGVIIMPNGTDTIDGLSMYGLLVENVSVTIQDAAPGAWYVL
jgi:hypothetical protein